MPKDWHREWNSVILAWRDAWERQQALQAEASEYFQRQEGIPIDLIKKLENADQVLAREIENRNKFWESYRSINNSY